MILCHQSGLPFAVALSGTALTPEHLSLLSRLSKRLVLALDADEAGVRSGLRSAEMAIAAGFDIKVPTFPEGKDPADLARENPELLKAAIRTSRPAVEFFLSALRPQAKDERGYYKLVEAQILPLIAAMESKIEQEHFIRILANRLGISETAVRTEVGKKSRPSGVYSSDNEAESIEQWLEHTPLERAVGMILSSLEKDDPLRARMTELVGEARAKVIGERLKGEEERLRFEFDSLGEDQAVAAANVVQTIERKLLQEKIALLQAALRAGSADEQSKALLEITSLKKREQELRT
jgi:DNA primase